MQKSCPCPSAVIATERWPALRKLKDVVFRTGLLNDTTYYKLFNESKVSLLASLAVIGRPNRKSRSDVV